VQKVLHIRAPKILGPQFFFWVVNRGCSSKMDAKKANFCNKKKNVRMNQKIETRVPSLKRFLPSLMILKKKN
jgi:hypothetical protein